MHPDQCQSPTFCMPFPILKLSALLSECMNSISINQCAARSPRGKQEGIFSPFSFTERTRERLRLVWRDTCFSSFLPARVNFVLKKRSGLLWNAMGRPRQIFFRPVPLAWRRPICSSASRGALPTSMPVLKLQRCPAHRGLDSIPRWCPYHRAASAAVREQYFVDNHGLCELFILARKLLETGKKHSAESSNTSVSFLACFYVWNDKCLQRYAVEAAVDLCVTYTNC